MEEERTNQFRLIRIRLTRSICQRSNRTEIPSGVSSTSTDTDRKSPLLFRVFSMAWIFSTVVRLPSLRGIRGRNVSGGGESYLVRRSMRVTVKALFLCRDLAGKGQEDEPEKNEPLWNVS